MEFLEKFYWEDTMKKKIILLVSFIIIGLIGLHAIDSVAHPLKVKGNVDLTRNLESSALKLEDKLFNGDEVETKAESFAAIQFQDESSIIKLFPNTILNIRTEKNGEKYNKRSLLKMGELWAKVEKGTGEFEIETPTTVASVKGTNFMITIGEDGTTELLTFEGEVIFQNKITGEAGAVLAGQRGVISGDQPIIILAIDPSDVEESQSEFINEEYEPIIEEEEEIPVREETPIEEPEVIEEELEAEGSSSSGPFNMGGGVGSVMLGEETYTQIRLMPELTFGKFGLGLDIDLMIDSNGDVRTEDWDSFEDYVNKVYDLRYGERGDAFYGRLGGFKSYTLGHGLVMKDYSNMLRYPEYKQIGIQLGGKLPVAGMTAELFTSNAVKNEILGGRLTIQPLNSTEIPLLNKLTFGGTVTHDRNQVKGLLDSDDDNFPDHFDDFPFDEDWHNLIDTEIDDYHELYFSTVENPTEEGFETWWEENEYFSNRRNPSFDEFGEDDITVFGVDYELPFVQNPLFTLSHYGEAAQIDGHGMGFIFPGFYSKFLIFHMNLEYRIYQDDFMPAFFDQLYDEQRAFVQAYDDTTIVLTKESLIEDMTKSHGWYGALTTNILNFLFVTVAYEDMYDENEDNYRSLWGKANFDTKIIPKLTKAEIGYSQTGFDKLDALKTPNAVISGSLGYSLGGNTQLVGSYQERYVDLDGNGKIKGEDETITSMSMGVEFSF
jgi:hypothetical protein